VPVIEYCCWLQPFLGSGEASNCISGKIRLGDETLATVSGHWDQEVFIKDKRSEVSSIIDCSSLLCAVHQCSSCVMVFILLVNLNVTLKCANNSMSECLIMKDEL